MVWVCGLSKSFPHDEPFYTADSLPKRIRVELAKELRLQRLEQRLQTALGPESRR